MQIESVVTTKEKLNMAQRRNPHHVEADEAARILAEADRTTRKASTSSERARRANTAAEEELANVHEVIMTYEEAQAAFDQAMEDRLELEQQIEAHERELAEAEAR